MQPTPPQLPRRLRRWAVRGALALLSTLAALALLEVGHRTWLGWRGKPYDERETKIALLRLSNPKQFFVPPGTGPQTFVPGSVAGLLHPFTGSEASPDTGGVLAHFRAGKAPNEYAIVVVGGSVAEAWTATSGAAFAGRLRASGRLEGREITLLNYAHASYKQPQQLMRIAYLLSLGAQPDAVIDIDGFNECAGAFDNALSRTNPVYPSYPSWGVLAKGFHSASEEQLAALSGLWRARVEARATTAFALRWRFERSSVLGTLALARLHRIGRERAELQDRLARSEVPLSPDDPQRRQVDGPDFDRSPAAVIQLAATNWFESSVSLAALCEARGIPFLHVLQPTLHDEGSKPLSDEERALDPGPKDWRPAVVMGYPLLRERGRELAARGIAFLDASQVFAEVPETLYYDPCHFHARGSEILAQPIAEAFVALLDARGAREAAEHGGRPAASAEPSDH